MSMKAKALQGLLRRPTMTMRSSASLGLSSSLSSASLSSSSSSACVQIADNYLCARLFYLQKASSSRSTSSRSQLSSKSSPPSSSISPSTSLSLSSSTSSTPSTSSSTSSSWSALQRRSYSSMGSSWQPIRTQYTKYRISKPWSTDSSYDDLFLAEPSRDDFKKFTKEIPLFLRFLRLLTDVEKRPKDFIDFARRCEHGLVVERDVFLTKRELLDCIWKNGYTEAEINAFEIAFPPDYLFHYPELSVIFGVDEEDAYKYCLRERGRNRPEDLVELKLKKSPNLISSYALVFVGVWTGLANTVLSNAWFLSKTFPFISVFYLLSHNFYRDIKEYFWKTERALVQQAQDQKNSGEELICKQMSKYSNDSRCLDFLSSFDKDTVQQLTQYRKSMVQQEKRKMKEAMLNRLAAMELMERQMRTALQDVMVKEVVESIRSEFASDERRSAEAFTHAVHALSGAPDARDIVAEAFRAAFRDIRALDLSSSAAPASPLLARLAAVFRRQETDFLNLFCVKKEEATEVQKIAQQCGGQEKGKFDFAKLDEKQMNRLEELFNSINTRMGFSFPDERVLMKGVDVGDRGLDEASVAFLRGVNDTVDRARARMRDIRLSSFLLAFH